MIAADHCGHILAHSYTIKNIPALVRVLYTGQMYTPVSGGFLLAVGISHITGMSV